MAKGDYKTVSVPTWAYEQLAALRDRFEARGRARLAPELEALLEKDAEPFTLGNALGMGCALARAALADEPVVPLRKPPAGFEFIPGASLKKPVFESRGADPDRPIEWDSLGASKDDGVPSPGEDPDDYVERGAAARRAQPDAPKPTKPKRARK